MACASRVQRRPGALLLRVASESDLLLESWALDRRADLFQEVFGVEVRMRRVDPRELRASTAAPAAPRRRRARGRPK
jgi:hypothetical protein